MVALVAAAASGQQLRAVYALQRRVHAAFGGGGGGSSGGAGPLQGLRCAARLLGTPAARLHAAAERLGLAGRPSLQLDVSALGAHTGAWLRSFGLSRCVEFWWYRFHSRRRILNINGGWIPCAWEHTEKQHAVPGIFMHCATMRSCCAAGHALPTPCRSPHCSSLRPLTATAMVTQAPSPARQERAPHLPRLRGASSQGSSGASSSAKT